MDMQMPKLTARGDEAGRRGLRAPERSPLTRCRAGARVSRRRCDDYAGKPIDRATLLAVVRRFLEKSFACG
jgi:hypothetical protein